MESTALPPIGAVIIAKYIPGITGTHEEYAWTQNMQVPVIDTKMEYCTDSSGFSAKRPVCVANFTSPNDVIHAWYVSEWEIVSTPDVIGTVTIPDNCTTDEYRAIIERLSNDLTEATSKADRWKTLSDSATGMIRKWEQWGIAVIERADQEATDRSWCDEYRGIREEITSNAPDNPGWNETWGECEYEVEFRLEVSVSVPYSLSVMAISEDDAREKAEDELQEMIDGGYDIEHHIAEMVDSSSIQSIDYSINSVRDY